MAVRCATCVRVSGNVRHSCGGIQQRHEPSGRGIHGRRHAWTSPRQRLEDCGGRTSASGSGAPCARTTAPTARPGIPSATTHARSRAYRWGEDGIAGICDDQQRLCLALALWNGRDPILKERLFGLTNSEGNHGEDVKELYYYLDATPTHSYLKMLYKYPQREFPYARLVEENRRRGKHEPEFELLDTGVFDDDRYFDVFVEYAKAGARRHPDAGHGAQPRPGSRRRCTCCRSSGSATPGRGSRRRRKPALTRRRPTASSTHASGARATTACYCDGDAPSCCSARTRPTSAGCSACRTPHGYFKDAFHDYVVHGNARRREPASAAAPRPRRTIALDDPGRRVSAALRLRLTQRDSAAAPFADFDAIVDAARVARPTSSTPTCSTTSPTPTRGSCSGRRSPA